MSEETEKNEAYENVDILYEDDSLIFVKIYSLSAAKYFGPEYIARRYSYYSNGDLFVIYDKDKDEKYVIYKPNDYDVNILNDDEYDVNINDLENRYPKLENLITDIYGKSSIYSALAMISRGTEMDKYELGRLDDLIGGFKFNSTKPENSMVTIQFDNEEYFKLFGISRYDIDFLTSLFGSGYYYGENVFYYSDMGDNDWNEGYLMRDFNEENIGKVKEIISYLSPEVAASENDDFFINASKILSDTFDREIGNIISEYTQIKNECHEVTAKKEIEAELGNPFMNYGIFEKTPFYKYVTTVKVLLALFKMSGKKNGTIHDVLSYLAKSKNVGPFEEYRYEYGCDDFDDETFQNEVERQLEKIEEKMFESDMFSDIEGYQEIIKKVLSKYKIGKSFRLPKDKEKFFTIEKIDPKTNRIIGTYASYKGLTGRKEKRSFSLEEFNNFLYQPELFESKRNKFIITENKKEKIALNWMNNNFGPDQLEVFESPKYPNSIFYKKNGDIVMSQDKENHRFWFSYSQIWLFFETFFF